METPLSSLSPPAWALRLRAASAYTPGVVGERTDGLIELASNENPYGPSPAALDVSRRALLQSHLYPEHDAGRLRATLASRWGLSASQVIVTPGTTPLIDLVARALVGPGLSAVVSERSFLAYTTSVEAAGGTLLRAPMRGDAIDLEAILACVQSDTRLIFLANPNNPTGTAFGAADWARFLARVPPQALVVLDEAYAEYAEGLAVGAEDVRRGAAVLVLRTFSKVYGLAGLRVGYGLGPAPLIGALSQLAVAFGVSLPAQRAAGVALDDDAHLSRSIAANRAGRQRLTEGLRALGLSPAPSQANFVYVDLQRPCGPVADALLTAGVRVRPLGGWGAPHAIRITVGAPDATERVLAALRDALGFHSSLLR